MSPIATTYCHLRLATKTSFQDYRKLTEWLGIYQYAYPDQRKVLPPLGVALAIHFKGDLTAAWHRYNDCEHFTAEVQKEITQWIFDSSN